MEDALIRCARQRDTHLWLRAYVLDALCAVAIAAGPSDGGGVGDRPGSLAGRSGMRELSVHAYLYRRDLGDRPRSMRRACWRSASRTHTCTELIDAGGPPLLDDLLGKVAGVARSQTPPTVSRPYRSMSASMSRARIRVFASTTSSERKRCGTSQHTSNSKPSGSLP